MKPPKILYAFDPMILVCGVAFAIVALSLMFGCAASVIRTSDYQTDGMERMALSAARIYAYCDGDLQGYGSATAVGPRQMLTAKHMVEACSPAQHPAWLAQFPDGTIWPVTEAGKSEEYDAARLDILEEWGDFPAWAEIAAYTPRKGQRVYFLTGDGRTIDEYPFYFKDGFVAGFDDDGDSLIISTHGVPGNSGCAVFDSNGALLAVLWGGLWDSSAEFVIVATRPQAWPELLPR